MFIEPIKGDLLTPISSGRPWNTTPS